MFLLEQSFTAHIPLLTATSEPRLWRKCWSCHQWSNWGLWCVQWSALLPWKSSHITLMPTVSFSVKYTTVVVHTMLLFLFKCYANQPQAFYSVLELSFFL